mmetsp:Transcript_48281/g.137912  ORF Transcript_48281/g.137912 Transcript_48281/m.137912 type:complete len:212 (+) Transcript_48281:665-1300(+)
MLDVVAQAEGRAHKVPEGARLADAPRQSCQLPSRRAGARALAFERRPDAHKPQPRSRVVEPDQGKQLSLQGSQRLSPASSLHRVRVVDVLAEPLHLLLLHEIQQKLEALGILFRQGLHCLDLLAEGSHIPNLLQHDAAARGLALRQDVHIHLFAPGRQVLRSLQLNARCKKLVPPLPIEVFAVLVKDGVLGISGAENLLPLEFPATERCVL